MIKEDIFVYKENIENSADIARDWIILILQITLCTRIYINVN